MTLSDEEYLDLINKHFERTFTRCESSNIFAYAWKSITPKWGDLYIAFKGGKIYQYHKVPTHTFANLENAESKGKFVSQNIVKEYSNFFTKYEITF